MISRVGGHLKCKVCLECQADFDNWGVTKAGAYFCSRPCIELYRLNPLAYEDNPNTWVIGITATLASRIID